MFRLMQNQLQTNEEWLIAECSRGNAKSQRLLYEKYASKMYVVALRYSKTTFEAEDILQESFIKIFNHIHEFQADCPLEFWIKRIVINTSLKQNRRKLDKARMEDVSTMPDEPSEEIEFSNYNFQQLLQLIQRLAPGYQLIFNLYAIEGYKHKEIAEMLDITEGTSKSQYARAKTLLQKMLLEEEILVHKQI